MADNNTQTRAGGVGIAGLLGVAFVVLKLTHVIAWPWVWVLAPFWMPLAAALAIVAIGLIVVLAMEFWPRRRAPKGGHRVR